MKTAKHVVAFLALESPALPLAKSGCVTGRSGSSVENRPWGVSQHAYPHVRANIFSTKNNLTLSWHVWGVGQLHMSVAAAPLRNSWKTAHSTTPSPPLLSLWAYCGVRTHPCMHAHLQRPGVLWSFADFDTFRKPVTACGDTETWVFSLSVQSTIHWATAICILVFRPNFHLDSAHF